MRWAYIARTVTEKHGNGPNTIVCAAVDRPGRDAAIAAAQWLREGLVIERVPVEWAREHFLTDKEYRP